MRVFEEWCFLSNGLRCLRGSNPTLSEVEVRHPTIASDEQWMIELIKLPIGDTLQIGAFYFKRLS